MQGIEYDWLNITGTATLNGKLDIDLYNGYDPTVGDALPFSRQLADSGTFTFFDLPYVPAIGTSFTVMTLSNWPTWEAAGHPFPNLHPSS